MAEGARLESVCGVKPTQGSNPCLSASFPAKTININIKFGRKPKVYGSNFILMFNEFALANIILAGKMISGSEALGTLS